MSCRGDYDLDVVKAIALVKGPLVNGAFGTNNFGRPADPARIGNPSPSLLVVLRQTPGGGQVPILVDLNRALRDRRERILVQPATRSSCRKAERSPGPLFRQTFFNFSLTWEAIRGSAVTGAVDVSAPSKSPAASAFLNNQEAEGGSDVFSLRGSFMLRWDAHYRSRRRSTCEECFRP